MAGKSGRNGAAQKNYYSAYGMKAGKQRQNRQERHSKAHPNDSTKLSTAYRKSKPESVTGWLTNQMDYELTPAQLTPGVDKKTKKEFTQYAAQSLHSMTKSERKKFAQYYARVRKLHKQLRAKKST